MLRAALLPLIVIHVQGGTVLDEAAVRAAFRSREGLWLRVTDPRREIHGNHKASSASVWRHDVPIALFSTPRFFPPDAGGLIFNPNKANARCAFAVDSNSMVRTKPGTQEKDPCGVMNNSWAKYEDSGTCPFGADGFVPKYYGKPMLISGFVPPYWNLEFAVCSFTDVPTMLDAQYRLLEACRQPPAGWTQQDLIGNATKLNSGLTAFNEAIVQPFTSDDIGAVFWAHSGPFRPPQQNDTRVCDIKDFMMSHGDTHPVFEFANVNFERPWAGCEKGADRLEPSPPECWAPGIEGWWNSVQGEGPDPMGFIRKIDRSEFLQQMASVQCSSVDLVIV